jgi:hypothetical protein
MGLRSFLDTMQVGVDASKQFSTKAEELRKQAAEQELAQMAPDMIDQGQFSQLAGQMAQAGDNSALREMIGFNSKMQLLKQKELTSPSTNDVIDPSMISSMKNVYGGTEADWAPFMGKKIALGEAFGKAIKGGDQYETTQARLNAQHADSILMNKEGKQFNVTQNIAKTEKELADQLSAVITNSKSFTEKATPASAILLIRAIIKATGDNRISDQDIAGLAIHGLPNKEAELENWLKGNQDQTLNEAQIAELNRLAKSVQHGAKARTAGILKSTVSTFYQGNPQLILNPDGSVKPKQRAFLKSKGFDVEVDEDGNPVIISNKYEVQQSGVNDKTGAVDKTVAEQLISQLKKKDPWMAEQALSQLGKIKSANAVKQIEMSLKQQLGIDK